MEDQVSDKVVMEGVVEYTEGFPLELYVKNGIAVIAATNEGGHNGVEIDAVQLVDWIKKNRPDLLD